MQISPLTVMVCPLDWGLGHASRMIPVISQFIRDGHKVIMAGSGRSGELMKTTFPELPFLALPSPIIRFGEGRHSCPVFFLQIPGLIRSVFREHKMITCMARLHAVDIIISDNRYGLFCRSAYTVFVTHQISPALPGLFRWLEYPLYRIIRSIIDLYDECWIPDSEEPLYNLSGKLSHRFTLPTNARYIGILSRFCDVERIFGNSPSGPYKIAIVLSGPEPQISIFENIVCEQLQNLTETAIVITGLKGETFHLPEINRPNLTLISHLDVNSFARVLREADHVICRSGYSGIMDLVALGIRATLVPTPGQSEQEYLGAYLAGKGWFRVVLQSDLDLSRILENSTIPDVTDFNHIRIRSGQSHFFDLYGKYGSYGKKSYQKT